MATDDMVRFPVGSRVTSRGNRFRGLIGTVMEYVPGHSPHVDWGETFDGHGPTVDRYGHNGHCYYMISDTMELVEGPPIDITLAPSPYSPSEFVEGFPPGTIVENIDGVALGNRTTYLEGRGSIRGIVIANREQATGYNLYVHVNFGDSFTGHTGMTDPHNGHCLYLYARELRIISMPSDIVDRPIVSDIPREIPRLRVSINRQAADPARYLQAMWRVDINNGPMPTKYDVQQAMDQVAVRRIGRRIWNSYDLNNIITKGIDTYGIDPEMFIAAITQASLAKQARESTGVFERSIYDSELQMAIGSQPALIAIGDQLFSLQPKGVVKTGRALAIIRERITKSAREQAVKIKAAAQAEAATIIRNGERQLTETRKQIERERAAISNIMTIPEWIGENGLMVRRWPSDSYKMAIGIEVSTEIRAWQLVNSVISYDEADTGHREPIIKQETVRWKNSRDRQPILTLASYHSVVVWMPFDNLTGRYSYQAARVMDDSSSPYVLPHIHTGRCCMTLDGLPEKMTDIKEYRKIATAINRGNQEVNVMSLLSSYNEWHPDIQNQCPKHLKTMIDKNIYHNGNLPDDLMADAIRTPVEVEAKETFNIETLRSRRIARGEDLPDIPIALLEGDGLAEVEEVEVETEDEAPL